MVESMSARLNVKMANARPRPTAHKISQIVCRFVIEKSVSFERETLAYTCSAIWS